ncbi:MAG: hypothetical protein H0X26_10070 [Alphaproteobacteria bacterium]|nr:hypothetical protein [Alphaproteobacteria bacterium]
MKNMKFIFALLSFSSIISVDDGQAMMFELIKGTSRVAVKKRIPAQMIQKRSLSTQGYKPIEPIKEDFQFDNITKEKIKFTDQSHERYRTEVSDSLFKEKIAITVQKDDHTLVVNIKKKEMK